MQQFTAWRTSRRGAEGTLRHVARDIVVFHDVTGQFCCQRGSLPTQVVLAPFWCPVARGRLPRSTASQLLGFLHAGLCDGGSATCGHVLATEDMGSATAGEQESQCRSRQAAASRFA